MNENYSKIKTQIEKIESLKRTDKWGPEYQLWLSKTENLVRDTFHEEGLKLFKQQETTTFSYIDENYNWNQYFKELDKRKCLLEGLLADTEADFKSYESNDLNMPTKEEAINSLKHKVDSIDDLSEFVREDVLKSEKYYEVKYALEDSLKQAKLHTSEIGQARIDKVVPKWRREPKPGIFIKEAQVLSELKPLVEVAIKTLNELGQSIPTNLPRYFSAGEGYDARVIFRQILKGATKKIDLADTYLHPETLTQIVGTINTSTPPIIRLVTSKNNSQLSLLSSDIDKLRSQYKNINVSLISSNLVHDRFIVVDDRVFHSGHSFHQLGEKASRIGEETELNQKKKIADDLDSWITSGKLEK